MRCAAIDFAPPTNIARLDALNIGCQVQPWLRAAQLNC